MKYSFLWLSILLLIPQVILAHPGRTAGDGCHYCRTNCSSWGVGWDVRHCHGGRTIPTPTYTPTPSYTPTLKDTSCPSNATYSYTEETCFCNDGYEISNDKTYCVFKPTTPSCTKNAYYHSIDKECKCIEGFKVSKDRERCETIPRCPTFGTYSYSLDKCVCKEGYRMDAMDRNCLKNRVAPMNGYLTRKSFACNNGYKKEFDRCVLAKVPTKIAQTPIAPIKPAPVKATVLNVLPKEPEIKPVEVIKIEVIKEEVVENFFDEAIEAQPISQEAQKTLQSVVEEALESIPKKSIWQEIMSWFSFSLK